MGTKYFDITEKLYGMTLRIHYEEALGVVTITNIQLQSVTFGGPGWYPNGTIKIGEETVLSMSYYDPVTHVFNVSGGASEAWHDIQAFGSGTKLPVSASAIMDRNSTTITVAIRLFRDSTTSARPDLNGSFEVDLSLGLVYIDTGAGFEPYAVYIDNGETWDRCIPYVDNGESWDLCC